MFFAFIKSDVNLGNPPDPTYQTIEKPGKAPKCILLTIDNGHYDCQEIVHALEVT